MPQNTVLVTGASGFVALHCIQQLLQQGYRVRGTLRSLDKEAALRKALGDVRDGLEFVQTDLQNDPGWDRAAQGCAYVLHLASPFPLTIPQDENELIVPAREGTLRVLRVAKQAGVERVVLTSSIAAIMNGHSETRRVFDERDWSNLEGRVQPYPKSKTLAEQAAWAFAREHGLELSVIAPGLILGPSLDGHYPTSREYIRKLMKREVPGVSRTTLFTVDVRDVALAHLAAMTVPEAANQRFVCVEGGHRFREIALILQRHFAARGYRISTLEFPDWVVRLVAIADQTVRLTLDELGKEYRFNSEPARRVLGWKPRPLEPSVLEMAEGMRQQGIV
ncbi:aldehyde reductase [uncultured Meiothermus sp.]|jgi:dihydroflavonol-4-reductase|uniref:SDR family oxidoreductase n=1 Tax=uncultured Meiothermus sp. TaxID=157471 RepID=UPI00261C5158|nr:aldehyde reductase [uncultured Meiothermus sp.]